ncbi:MAG: MGMT family protein [Elusimicrobia bacterium]|nr:MGMT family protein [Elusimicrobiota bacterium]
MKKQSLVKKVNSSTSLGVDDELRRTIKTSKYPEFYKKVWLECLKIKHGQISTYSEIARRIGHPNSQRAVGTALSKNPFAPQVPCHRIICKNGKPGGYSGGLSKKIKLLKKERNFI